MIYSLLHFNLPRYWTLWKFNISWKCKLIFFSCRYFYTASMLHLNTGNHTLKVAKAIIWNNYCFSYNEIKWITWDQFVLHRLCICNGCCLCTVYCRNLIATHSLFRFILEIGYWIATDEPRTLPKSWNNSTKRLLTFWTTWNWEDFTGKSCCFSAGCKFSKGFVLTLILRS